MTRDLNALVLRDIAAQLRRIADQMEQSEPVTTVTISPDVSAFEAPTVIETRCTCVRDGDDQVTHTVADCPMHKSQFNAAMLRLGRLAF